MRCSIGQREDDWRDGQIDRWKIGQTYKRKGRQRRMDGRTDGRTGRQVNKTDQAFTISKEW
jgi:hypothetical protein